MEQATGHVSRYADVLTKQARQILAQPAEQVMHRADGLSMEAFRPAGQRLASGAPSAAFDAEQAQAFLSLCEQLADALESTDDPDRLRIYDGLGHSRAVYVPFMTQLLLRVGWLAQLKGRASSALSRAVATLALPDEPPREQTALTLWRATCRLTLAAWLDRRDADADHAAARIDQLIDLPGRDGALHVFTESEQLLDTWWFNELTGLHALVNAQSVTGRRDWADAVRRIALHHLENIQADHVTSQPWGLAAYLSDPDTAVFGEQQMHEATTGMLSPFSRSTVLPGLLMADAAQTLRWVAR